MLKFVLNLPCVERLMGKWEKLLPQRVKKLQLSWIHLQLTI